MSTVSTASAQAQEVPHTWPRWLLRFRSLLLVAAVLVLVAAVATGDRSGSLADLEADLADGDVDAVTVVGGLLDGSTGSALQEVHWRDGLVERRAEVWQVTPGESPVADGRPVSTSEIDRELAGEHPGLTVLREERPSSHSQLAGWRVHGWTAVGAFVVLGVALALLLSGPQPWWATRWAWFWLLWTPPGFVALLLLAGPAPLVPAPRRPLRRLTGGWAFLLSCVVSALLRRL